ncbi:DNA gyrase inhibitor YacG [Phaeobacter sp. HF9A]|uniref:DNA gyrase inhibitor YacG n=1 Tax=Phaeobacter sp. HF9A TaxID=2721561 RepID=UPI00143080F4|nr:DNA gyrase inhibitor YacG [Phaeobacter sp. HF9A]NIZ12787.1 DNA gyrase inhibitor YacG [Phaeobacter sp. HF9A]
MSCPICSEPTVHAYRPFCSKRCADLDLAKWLNGAYSVPSEDQDDLEEALDTLERDSQTEH